MSGGQTAGISRVPLPKGAKGMKEWNPDKFGCSVQVPFVDVSLGDMANRLKQLKPYLFLRPGLNPVQKLENQDSIKRIYLDPEKVSDDFLSEMSVECVKHGRECVTLRVDQFLPHELLKSVLIDEEGEGLSSFSAVGHIAHINLKEHLIPYGNVIGQILLRHKNIKTVLTKTSEIDSTYRNFKFNVLAGEDNYVTQVKETGLRFQLDFSKVYWNPRLATEHEKMVLMIPNDGKQVIFDVFAGIGPFALPIAKKRSPHKVFANDLNPESFKWLNMNTKLNKIKDDVLETFNLDGREFIKTIIKRNLLKMQPDHCAHIIMNLPALAVEFLDVFPDLLQDDHISSKITVYVYIFSNAEDKIADVKERVHKSLLNKEVTNISVDYVRSVAPQKDMFRASFNLNENILNYNLSKKRKLVD